MSLLPQSLVSWVPRSTVFARAFRRVPPVLGIVLLVLCALVARFHNITDVLVGGKIYFVDADCYSRMSRAAMVSNNPLTPVRSQSFENWPYGVESHATAPMDYGIVVLERLLKMIWPEEGRLSVLHNSTLDVAGALISPILGGLLCGFLWIWAAGLRSPDGARIPGWWAVPIMAAISPPLVHATALGRPDHQSLLVLLLSVGLCAEQRLVAAGSRPWAWLGGTAWGAALWVSLYEPLVLLCLVGVTGIVFSRDTWSLRVRSPWLGPFLLVLFLGWLVDGIKVVLPDPEWSAALRKWAATIGELQSLRDPADLSRATGLLLWCGPLFVPWRAVGVRRAAGGLLLLTVMAGLASWQIRWTPYLVLVFLCCLPLMLSRAATSKRCLLVFVLSLTPVYSEWSRVLDPDARSREERHLDRSERLNARLAADRMRSAETTPFLAVWWWSPALAYWSGQPAVAGSGHEGISGIVDSARFFLSEGPSEAREMLERRGVKIVVASDGARAVENSAAVLGRVAPPKATAERLWESKMDPVLNLEAESNVTTFRLLRVR